MSDSSMELSYEIGERVRVDIPDETYPDFRFHGKNGGIISVIRDDRSSVTGDTSDDSIYRVELDIGDVVDVRAGNLRPSI